MVEMFSELCFTRPHSPEGPTAEFHQSSLFLPQNSEERGIHENLFSGSSWCSPFLGLRYCKSVRETFSQHIRGKWTSHTLLFNLKNLQFPTWFLKIWLMDYFEVQIGLIFWVPLSFRLKSTVVRKCSLDYWNSFKFVKPCFIAQQMVIIPFATEKKVCSLVLKYSILYLMFVNQVQIFYFLLIFCFGLLSLTMRDVKISK